MSDIQVDQSATTSPPSASFDKEVWWRVQREKNLALASLIQSWLDDDESAEEQKETWEFLREALDEDRLSDRKLFS